ncbi:MAG TPA: SDR family NAD(P)-dependent oxidoreductase [Pseudomonadales bacterium]|nr:SDR family NAD(P)-dependent oxidoreductase [Pseudomonadales bacterium]
MSDKIRFRIPKILPYFQRLIDHWEWNIKSVIKPQDALRDRVAGKVVMLTGASSGIGALVAHRLAEAGATVLLTARSKDTLTDMAEDIRAAGGKAFVYAGNLTDMNDCDRICQEALRDHGRVDILINNAGRSIRRSIKFTFDRFHDYERTMQLNYFGAIRMAMNLLPGMVARNEGHIVNVSTLGVQANPARFSAYLASKWALEGWSWVAANEFAHTGIRFSTLNYPLVRTPMIAPTKIYRYMPVMSPQTAVRWMLDIIITQNKRKMSVAGLIALAGYYLSPKTAETFINATYQVVHEEPPANYEETLQKFKPDTAAQQTAEVVTDNNNAAPRTQKKVSETVSTVRH